MSKYDDQIAAGLQKAYDERAETGAFDVTTDKWVVFSDHHKGKRDGADDFVQCERAYNAALGYYLEKGYTLIILGDGEELWECSPKDVMKAYKTLFELENQFHKLGRYRRYFGNHDSDWQRRGQVNEHLKPIFGENLKVGEALRVRVHISGMDLGELFFIHGHQGTLESDQYSWLSRIAVRNGWAVLQRIAGKLGIKVKSTTPAKDFELRQQHNIAMYNWAVKKSGLVLIAGHTHRPVFKSKNKLAILEDQLAEARKTGATDVVAELRAQLEAARVQDFGQPSGERAVEQQRPCYFNTGCCSFSDGDVTAIEIANGRIGLVRWPDNNGDSKPQLLASEDLRVVFGATRAPAMDVVGAVN